MPIDVTSSITIDRPRAEVTAFAADPGARFANVVAPVMEIAVRRANQKDLEKLKGLLEAE